MKTNETASIFDSALLEQRIRERAYDRWLELGCPAGDDHAHWFWAQQQVLAELAPDADSPPSSAPVQQTIKNTVAMRLHDPEHRFHSPGTAHDARLDVVAGEARQRVRGRHYDSSLRAQPKKSK